MSIDGIAGNRSRYQYISNGYIDSGTDAYVCSENTGGFFIHDAFGALDADTVNNIDFGFVVEFFDIHKVEI